MVRQRIHAACKKRKLYPRALQIGPGCICPCRLLVRQLITPPRPRALTFASRAASEKRRPFEFACTSCPRLLRASRPFAPRVEEGDALHPRSAGFVFARVAAMLNRETGGCGRGFATESSALSDPRLSYRNASMRRFEGRVAVVTGAARGMGKAVALRLGEEGAAIVAVDINREGAAATAQAIGGASIAHACDIGDEDSVAKLFDAVVRAF